MGGIIFFIFHFNSSSPVQATEYYAFRLAGADCTLCHADPKTGSLNPFGKRFQEEGYSYPLTWKQVFFYLLIGSSLLILLLGLYRRYRLWHLGKNEMKWNRWKERWKGLLIHGLGQRTTLRNIFPGGSHLLLYGSLIILSLLVLSILFQEYLFHPLWKWRWIDSDTYPWLRLLLDGFGFVGWLGVLFLALRRYLLRPKALDNQGTDAFSLLLLFFVFLTGFSLTGIRNELYQSTWSGWAPTASTAASILTHWTREEGQLKDLFSILFWIHLLLSLSLISYLPFSRLLHLFSSPLNIFFRNLRPKGALSKLDLESSEIYGVGKIEEFDWKHLLELDACTRCGRCQEACPAHLTGKHLNPKKVVQDLKRHLERSSEKRESLRLIGEVVTEDEIWECTTCRNCLEHCPVFIEPMAKLIELRRNLALHQGKIPRETHFAFRSIERKGNPWGFDSTRRMWWTKDLGVREVLPGEQVDFLFWVGCYSSYDDRSIEVATRLVRILQRAGLDFGVLGNAEWCCGIDLRRMGHEYLYQVAVQKNIEQLQQVKFDKIITTCPHCFNTLKNEYRQFGVQWEVLHYTSLLDELIREGKVPFHPRDGQTRITFHDSCYLGRYNDGYDPPRRILKSMPDLALSEMERRREKGFCCGGGGCHMWMEERAGRRINETRVKEAAQTGAEIVATVCPLCMISLDSAVKVLNLDKKIRVMDILELVGERMNT